MAWQLQEAKNKFSEVVNIAQRDGPQIISRHGKNAAVILSYEQYCSMSHKRKSVKAALMAADLSQLDLSRDTSPTGRATPIDFGV